MPVRRFRGKSDGPRNCTAPCPACARMCVSQDGHENMHKCGLHEWTYGFGGRLTITLFTLGMKPPEKQSS